MTERKRAEREDKQQPQKQLRDMISEYGTTEVLRQLANAVKAEDREVHDWF